MSKLSETYESRASFPLRYTNFPDSLWLNTNADDYVTAKLETTGFRFLSMGINPKELELDIREIKQEGRRYYLEANDVKAQLDRQFSNNVSLLELDRRRLYVDLYEVATKKIKVTAGLNLNLAPNHILDGPLQIDPPEVALKGPQSEIAMIDQLHTVPLVLNEVTDDFSHTLSVVRPDSLTNILITPKFVKISGKVVHFSEKEFVVDVSPIGFPDGYQMRTFPKSVKLICKAGLERLKQLHPNDFKVEADFRLVGDSGASTIGLELPELPEGVYAIRLLEDEVEFVLERE